MGIGWGSYDTFFSRMRRECAALVYQIQEVRSFAIREVLKNSFFFFFFFSSCLDPYFPTGQRSAVKNAPVMVAKARMSPAPLQGYTRSQQGGTPYEPVDTRVRCTSIIGEVSEAWSSNRTTVESCALLARTRFVSSGVAYGVSLPHSLRPVEPRGSGRVGAG